MAKKSSPQKVRSGAERLHIVISKDLAKKLRESALRDGQALSIKIERTLEKGLAA